MACGARLRHTGVKSKSAISSFRRRPESRCCLFCIAVAMFDLDVGFRAHTAGSFLLHGQKKRTKEKAARMTCPANNAGYPRQLLLRCPTFAHPCARVLLSQSGAHYNSHKKRAQTVMRFIRYGLRCSAASYGGKVKNGGFCRLG